MNTETNQQDALRLMISELQQSTIRLAETIGLGDDMKKQFEADEREISGQFALLTNLLDQANQNLQNPEYVAQHKRECIEHHFPGILSKHITKLMTIVNRQDITRVDHLLKTLKQGGIEAIWPHIATDFTAEIKRACGTVFSDEEVRLGAMQVTVNMQQMEQSVGLQKSRFPKAPRETSAFAGFRRGFLNSNSSSLSASQSENTEQDPSHTQNNSYK